MQICISDAALGSRLLAAACVADAALGSSCGVITKRLSLFRRILLGASVI